MNRKYCSERRKTWNNHVAVWRLAKKSYSLKSFVLVGGAKRNIFINKCVYIKVAVNRQQHLGKANGKQIQWTLCVRAGFFLLYFVSLSWRWFMIADQSMCFFPVWFPNHWQYWNMMSEKLYKRRNQTFHLQSFDPRAMQIEWFLRFWSTNSQYITFLCDNLTNCKVIARSQHWPLVKHETWSQGVGYSMGPER